MIKKTTNNEKTGNIFAWHRAASSVSPPSKKNKSITSIFKGWRQRGVVLLLRLLVPQLFLLPVLQELYDDGVPENRGFLQWRASPAVAHVVRHAALAQEKLHAVHVTLGCSQVQRRATVVVGKGHVHTRKFVSKTWYNSFSEK